MFFFNFLFIKESWNKKNVARFPPKISVTKTSFKNFFFFLNLTNPKLLNGSVLHIRFNLFNQHDACFGEEMHAWLFFMWWNLKDTVIRTPPNRNM